MCDACCVGRLFGKDTRGMQTAVTLGRVEGALTKEGVSEEVNSKKANSKTSILYTLANWVPFITLMLYIWFLPYWSHYANTVWFSQFQRTPAAQVICYHSQNVMGNFLQIAIDAGRFNSDGQPIGCGCGECVFGESACPMDSCGYSVSSYIGTAPGTGLMAMFSLPLLLQFYFYSTAVLHSIGATNKETNLIRISQFGFIFFYMCFMVATNCYFASIHAIFVVTFAISGIAHYSLLGSMMYKYGMSHNDKRTQMAAKVVVALVIVLRLSIVLVLPRV